jgi:iron complex transport system substrate-binding protein
LRIVSLLPSATEILFGIGAGEEVVGVTHECDYPPAALGLPKLTCASTTGGTTSAEIDRHVRAAVHAGSSLYHLDSALLARLDPDLIVTQELCAVCAVSYEIVDSATRLLNSCHPERSDVMLSVVEARRTRIISLEPACVQDVLANITQLGEIAGHSTEARDLVAQLESRIMALRVRTAGRAERPRTLVLEWTDPPMSAGHWIPELVELAGGSPSWPIRARTRGGWTGPRSRKPARRRSSSHPAASIWPKRAVLSKSSMKSRLGDYFRRSVPVASWGSTAMPT